MRYESRAGACHRLSRSSLLWLLILLSFSAVLDTVVAIKASVTADEPLHVAYGGRILHLDPERRNAQSFNSQMPISALNAAPVQIAAQFEIHRVLHPLSADTNLLLARIPTIVASLVLAVLVFLWAYDLYGEVPAMASCLLCVLSPNLIAHGTLATTDMYHAVGVVGGLYFLRRFLIKPVWSRALAAALALALAQITKPFALVLYPIAGLAVAYVMFRRNVPALTPKRVAIFTLIAAGCLIAVLNVAFCFDRTFKPADYYVQKNGQGQVENAGLHRALAMPLVRDVPVPVPYPYLEGLAMTRADERAGRTFGNIYLLGELRDPSSPQFRTFKSYYAVIFFYKEPIALQLLAILGLVWIFRNRRFEDLMTGEGLLLLEAAILVLVLSFFSRAQIGIRHILPVLAIETVIAGAAFCNFASKPRWQKVVLCGLVLWLGVSVASYYPQMIPYTNEWVHNRKLAYKILADSNLDWGQDVAIANEFVRKNPDVILDPPTPVAGRVLLRANRLTGIYGPDFAVSVAAKYEPEGQVGYAHFLFVVPKEGVPQLRRDAGLTETGIDSSAAGGSARLH